MELGPEWADAGLWGLFLASFLAATIFPLGSELVLGAMLFGPWSAWSLWLVASMGNWAGGMSGYGLGSLGDAERIARWMRIPMDKVQRWNRVVARWGSWTALFTWLPVVGDPLAIALGLFRVPAIPVAILMFVGKALRYALFIAAVRYTF